MESMQTKGWDSHRKGEQLVVAIPFHAWHYTDNIVSFSRSSLRYSAIFIQAKNGKSFIFPVPSIVFCFLLYDGKCRWRSMGSTVFFAVDRQIPEKVSLFSTFSSGWFWLDHTPCHFETLEHHYGFWKPPLLCLWFRNFWQKWFPCAHGRALGGPQEVQVQ